MSCVLPRENRTGSLKENWRVAAYHKEAPDHDLGRRWKGAEGVQSHIF